MRKKTVLMVVMLVLLGGVVFAKMPAYSALTELLVDVKGWKAEAAEGSQMNHPLTGEMVSANREYARDGAEFSANLIAGGPAQMAMMPFAMNFSMDSTEEMIKNETVDGFKIHRQHNKSTKDGSVIVILRETPPAAVLVLSYCGMDDAEAFAVAKKFSWGKMRKAFEG